MGRRRNLTRGLGPRGVGAGRLSEFLVRDDTPVTLSDAALRVVGDSRSRTAGLALYQRAQRATSGGTNAADSPFAGWATSATPSGTAALAAGYVFDASSKLEEGTGAALQIATQAEGCDEDLVTVLREHGAYLFDADGTLLWVEPDDDTATVYDAFYMPAAGRRPGTLSRRRIADLVTGNGYGVWGHRDLDVTDSSAAPSASDTGTMTPDSVVRFTCSAPTGDTELFVRVVDASNYDSIKIDASGNLTYTEVVSGTPNTLITASGVISGGETIDAVLNDADVSLFYDSTSAGTTSSASNNTAGTGWELDTEADAATDLEFRTLDGAGNVGSANHPGYGVATAVLAGPRAAGDTFTHEADCVLEWQLDALPTASSNTVEFRLQDANNNWFLQATSIGHLNLYERVGGSPTSRGSALSVLSGGERITAICDDEEITVYYDTTLAFTYSSATNFKTKTAGEVANVGADGVLSNLIAWPRDLDSAPNTSGAADAQEALERMAG